LTVLKLRYPRGDFIGIFMRAVGDWVLIPLGSGEKVKSALQEALSARLIEVSVYSSALIGLFTAGNSRCLLVPHIVSREEYDALAESVDLEVVPLKSRITALGNAILANDYGALIHPEFTEGEAELIEEALGVKVFRGTIAGIPVVGSLAVVTNKGGLVTEGATEEELRRLEEIFDVEFLPGTINDGSRFIRLGLVANDRGAVVGYSTTPLEINTVVEALRVEP